MIGSWTLLHTVPPAPAAAAFKAGALPAVAAASVSAGTSSTRRGPSPGW
ncbi:hypothetical protein OHA79_36295 [Streptomyces sp. NBC_00841]|nr:MULTISPECIES: hypothetical protein [unclassified Streptomyces]MCX4531597.1 hypothetical protein [Streptomyces sp. NBC_01669]WSA02833.1 hypothetical protein OHA79_36295 [Streptomyces sp. NBC_00841]